MLAAGSSRQTLVLHLQGLGFVCSLWDHGDSRLRPMSLRRLRLMSLQASRGRCTGPGPLRGRQDRAAAVRPEPLVQQRRHENGAGAVLTRTRPAARSRWDQPALLIPEAVSAAVSAVVDLWWMIETKCLQNASANRGQKRIPGNNQREIRSD